MAIIKCPECGHQVSDQAPTCPSCGIIIAGRVTRCLECGEVIFNDQALCPNCHSPLQTPGGQQNAAQPTNAQSTNAQNRANAQAKAHGRSKFADDGSSDQSGGDNNGKGGRKGLMTLVIALVIALILVFVGIYYFKHIESVNEQEEYENAMQSTDQAVLQNYLDRFEDAPQAHRDSVLAHLEVFKAAEQEWNNVLASKSKTDFVKFISRYPDNFHVTEAKIIVDSLDWAAAMAADTPEAYQQYLRDHADGNYVEEATEKYGKLDAERVSADEKDRLQLLFVSYFNALGQAHEAALLSTLDDILVEFLHKGNASKNDVISHMRKLHDAEGVTTMSFRVNDNMTIKKAKDSNDNLLYEVSFSVDQTVNHGESKDTFVTYKVQAKVNSHFLISQLNMQKIV